MSGAKPTVIFFDCWYTLFTSDMADDLKRICEILNIPFNRPFVKHFEQAFMTKPGLDQRVWARQLLKALGLPRASRLTNSIVEIIESGFDRQRPYDDALETLEQLRHKYRLGLISNTSQAAFEHLDQTFALSERFDYITTSFAVGVIKPDQAIFSAALEQAQIPAGQAIMIGDNPLDDIEGAQAAGFGRTILLDRRNRFPSFPGRIDNLYQIGTLDA